MKEEYIHRKARFHRALCGNESENCQMSLNDKEVTCPVCLEQLKVITGSVTQTRMKAIGRDEQEENGKGDEES